MSSDESATAHLTERELRKSQLATSYRIFASLRWGDMGDGHITARDPIEPDCLWVLKYPVSFDAARPQDMLLIGPDGSVVEGEGSYNRTAYHIHYPIHEARPEVVAAAHTHTPWGTPFATERRLIEPITQESCVFFENHGLFDDEEVQVQSVEGGKRIALALETHQAVILANHGLLTVGSSVAEAVGAFVMMERTCEAQLKARSPLPISPDSARAAKDGLGVPEIFSHVFNFLVMRHT